MIAGLGCLRSSSVRGALSEHVLRLTTAAKTANMGRRGEIASSTVKRYGTGTYQGFKPSLLLVAKPDGADGDRIHEGRP